MFDPSEATGDLTAEDARASSASGEPPVLPNVPGYEVLEQIGRGGMGVVYKARQTTLKRLVALKVILAGEHASVNELARFRAEAEVIARLQHPNIVQIHEAGIHHGLPFLSLELCEGGSLEKVLEAGPLSPTESATLVRTLAEAMEAAHAAKVIHRDLKPANVLMQRRTTKHTKDTKEDKEEREKSSSASSSVSCLSCVSWLDFVPKITDFGLARKLDESGRTQSGAILGTPSYMPPEQAAGKVREIGPAADVYALGAILYECLTGRPPFRGSTPVETVLQVIADDPVPPRQRRGDVPKDLETVCLKCLHKDPARRYPTAQALADDLGRWLAGEPVLARRAGRLERTWRKVRRRPVTVLGLLFAVFALLGLAWGYHLWQQRSGQVVANEDATIEFVAAVLWPEEGVVPAQFVSQQEAERVGGYRVVKRRGRIERIDAVGQAVRLLQHNPYHYLTATREYEGPRFETSYRYLRDPDGRLQEVTAHGPDGRLLWSLRHDGERRGFREGIGAEAGFRVSGDGLERWIRCLGADGEPGVGPRQRHGLRVTAGADGQVIKQQVVDGQGQVIPGEDHCVLHQEPNGAFRERAREGACVFVGRWLPDRIYRLEALDANDKPTRTFTEFARWECRLAADGKEMERSKWIVDDQGAVALVVRTDGAGRTLEQAVFTRTGQRILQTGGYHRHVQQYDSRGLCVACSYFGIDGKPALRTDGCHAWAAKYDERGTQVEGVFFGFDRQPVNIKDGYCRWTMKYDNGQLRETAYWRKTTEGREVLLRRQDGANRILEEAAFDAAGLPMVLPGGYHRFVTKYDERGLQVEWSAFGVDGKPCMHKDGYHRWNRTYDRHGNNVGLTIVDTQQKPCIGSDGSRGWTRKYDEHNRVVEHVSFGVDGKPITTTSGHAQWTQDYDDKGQPTVRTHRVATAAGQLAVLNRVNAANRLLEEAKFTPEGKPGVLAENYHRVIRKLDDQGKVLEAAYFGLDNKPIEVPAGFARIRYLFDAEGNVIDSERFAADGKALRYRIVVEHVEAGSAADKAGLRADDVIVAIAGKSIDSLKAWTVRLQRRGKPGAAEAIEAMRAGKKVTLEALFEDKGVRVKEERRE